MYVCIYDVYKGMCTYVSMCSHQRVQKCTCTLIHTYNIQTTSPRESNNVHNANLQLSCHLYSPHVMYTALIALYSLHVIIIASHTGMPTSFMTRAHTYCTLKRVHTHTHIHTYTYTHLILLKAIMRTARIRSPHAIIVPSSRTQKCRSL